MLKVSRSTQLRATASNFLKFFAPGIKEAKFFELASGLRLNSV